MPVSPSSRPITWYWSKDGEFFGWEGDHSLGLVETNVTCGLTVCTLHSVTGMGEPYLYVYRQTDREKDIESDRQSDRESDVPEMRGVSGNVQ